MIAYSIWQLSGLYQIMRKAKALYCKCFSLVSTYISPQLGRTLVKLHNYDPLPIMGWTVIYMHHNTHKMELFATFHKHHVRQTSLSIQNQINVYTNMEKLSKCRIFFIVNGGIEGGLSDNIQCCQWHLSVCHIFCSFNVHYIGHTLSGFGDIIWQILPNMFL